MGRRISKQCPEKRINIEYIWDGDQLAYTITERNGKLDSERHSIFNGWELIAQQDYYSEFRQTPDGNKTEWKHQTHYAVCQPNGQVLSLFDPEGKTGWYKPQMTLWGLDLNVEPYQAKHPLNPNLLFAGQWLDEESGLAYNRFRYYDLSSGNYISSDPIGLNGGEMPYGYVHNPIDWVDLFGLASCRMPSWMPSKKGYQRHHIIPYKLKDHPALKRMGLDINSAQNMIYLPVAKAIHPTKSLHNGWSKAHKNYNKKIESILNRAEKQNWSREQILDSIRTIRRDLNTGKIGDLK